MLDIINYTIIVCPLQTSIMQQYLLLIWVNHTWSLQTKVCYGKIYTVEETIRRLKWPNSWSPYVEFFKMQWSISDNPKQSCRFCNEMPSIYIILKAKQKFKVSVWFLYSYVMEKQLTFLDVATGNRLAIHSYMKMNNCDQICQRDFILIQFQDTSFNSCDNKLTMLVCTEASG